MSLDQFKALDEKLDKLDSKLDRFSEKFELLLLDVSSSKATQKIYCKVVDCLVGINIAAMISVIGFLINKVLF